jgi:hypothetical protein
VGTAKKNRCASRYNFSNVVMVMMVLTTELVYNLMMGSKCSHGKPKVGYDMRVPSRCFAYSALLQLRPATIICALCSAFLSFLDWRRYLAVFPCKSNSKLCGAALRGCCIVHIYRTKQLGSTVSSHAHACVSAPFSSGQLCSTYGAQRSLHAGIATLHYQT